LKNINFLQKEKILIILEGSLRDLHRLVLRPHKPRVFFFELQAKPRVLPAGLSVLCLNVMPPASTYLFTAM
jgi:hypothetical protein